MTNSIDSNVMASLWDLDDANNVVAMQVIDATLARGKVVVCGAVYAELMGGVGRTAEMLDELFAEVGIEVDWKMDRETWILAGRAYEGYVVRRKNKEQLVGGRQLTDFLIGAHAMRHGYKLVTFDKRLYRAAFPGLEIINR